MWFWWPRESATESGEKPDGPRGNSLAERRDTDDRVGRPTPEYRVGKNDMNKSIVGVEAVRPLGLSREVRSRNSDDRVRVVVWGTGQCASDFVANLRPDVDLVAYVDGNASRWGVVLNGRPIVSPVDLGSMSFDRLVIASMFVPEIVQQLETLGLHSPDTTLAFTGAHDWWQCDDLLVRRMFNKLQVGITSRCNLMCRHCPRDTDASVYRDVGLFQFQKYLSRFDPAQFTELLVSDFGENTMLKEFLSYLRAAKQLGWNRVEFVTNATNGKRDLWETIFGEDLARRVIVSLEAANAEGFERVRGFPWARFTANVATIADCIAKNGLRAELVFNAVCMKSNLHELPHIVDFAARHAAQLYMVHLNPSNMFNNPLGQPDNHLDRVRRDEVVSVFREVQQRARDLGVRVSLPETFPELEGAPPAPAPAMKRAMRSNELLCMQPFRWVEVGDNGNVYPCCQMAKRFPVGNLNSATFEEIWSGPAYRRLLNGLRPGGTPVEVCRGCNMYLGKNF